MASSSVNKDCMEPLTIKVNPSKTLVVYYPPSFSEDYIEEIFEDYNTLELVTKKFTIFTFSTEKEAAEALRKFDNRVIGGKCEYIDNLTYSHSKARQFIRREPSSIELVNVLLDCDTCPLPKNISANKFLENIKRSLSHESYKLHKMHMYGTKLEKKDQRNNLLTDLSSLENIKVHMITRISKSAADHGKKRDVLPFDSLHLKILSLMVRNNPPFPLLIITSNLEILKPIEYLVKRNYQVLLAYDENLSSEEMNSARAHLIWTCTNLYKGERAIESSI